MRLLAVSPTGYVSGAERVLLRVLAAAADQRGWEIGCACPPGRLVGLLAEQGTTAIAIPDLKLPPGPVPAAGSLWLSRQLRAAARLWGPVGRADVVLVNGLLGLPALRALRRRAPIVWLVHDVIIRRDRLVMLDRLRRTADLAVAVSEATAGPLRARGIPTRVVRNGTVWPVDPLPGRPPGPPVIGCNAQLTSWKGQSVLLDAVARMGRSDLRVELMGGYGPKDGPYVETLRRRTARPDLRGRVELLGNLEDPLARMRTWTVAVSASVDPEAGPLAPLEAMSIGLPMVATDHGGTPEVLGGAGLLVPPGDPAAMAEAITRMLEDGALWSRAHAEGPRLVAGGLTLQDQLDTLLHVLEDAAAIVRTGR